MDFIYSKHFKYIAGLLVVTLFLVAINSFGWINPIESAAAEIPRPFVYVASSAGRGVKSFFSIFVSIASLNKKNAELQNTVVHLQEEVASLQQDGFENQLLRQELNYRSAASLSVVSADVIGKDPSGFSQTIVINIGSSQGIAVGDAVEAQGAFIGIVTQVSALNSKVLLITDPQSSIDAEIASNGDKGVLKGSYGSGISITMISQTAPLTAGDQVVTAGLSGSVPQGLLIGSIGEIQSGKNQLLQEASVVPAADFNNLIYVGVIKK